MTRIISGRAGGLRLQTPAGAGTRPTSDRVREALFSRLEHLEVLDGARVLDLYAGSGALGLEAASRGAVDVVLVEADRAAAKVARANVVAFTGQGSAGKGEGDRMPGISVLATTVQRALATGPSQPRTLVFLDPPYDLDEGALAADLAALVEQRWLAEDALVVVERSSRSPEPSWPEALEVEGERRYGETRIWFAGPRTPDSVA